MTVHVQVVELQVLMATSISFSLTPNLTPGDAMAARVWDTFSDLSSSRLSQVINPNLDSAVAINSMEINVIIQKISSHFRISANSLFYFQMCDDNYNFPTARKPPIETLLLQWIATDLMTCS